MIKTFKDYVNSKCYNDIENAIIDYLKDHGDFVCRGLSHFRDYISCEYDSHEVRKVFVQNQSDTKITCSVDIEVTLNCSWDSRYDIEQEQKSYWLTVHCDVDLGSIPFAFAIKEVCSYNPKLKPVDGLDGQLVPYINKEKYEEVAEQILQKYYPEALQKPMKVDMTKLADNIGLNIKYGSIDNEKIYGQIFFADCNLLSSGKVKAGTIFVDKKVKLLVNIGSENFTIAHECCHWLLHRKAFLFQKSLNSQLTNIQCGVSGAMVSNLEINTHLLEVQANAIASRLLMPKKQFIKKAEEFISSMREGQTEVSRLDVMECVIDMLASEFAVSKSAVKIRLVDCGFAEAVGCREWVDDKRVEPYLCPLDYVAKKQTFTASALDVAAETLAKPKLKELTQTGKVLYVDGHLVWNNKKYWSRTSEGLKLTKYARGNIAESCLPFKVIVENQDAETFNLCWLNREQNSSCKIRTEFEEDVVYGIQDLADNQQEISGLYNELGNDIRHNFEVIFKYVGGTKSNIAQKAGVDIKSINNWENGEHAQLLPFVRFCLALHLPYMITRELLSVVNLRLRTYKEDEFWIEQVMTTRFLCEVEECVKFLHQHGVNI